MANSYVLYNGNGVTTDFTVPFGYLDQDHVSIQVSGITVPSTWVSSTVIRATTAPGVGTGNVKVVRATPTDPLVVYADGSGLTADDLNTSNLQNFYVSEEIADAFEGEVLTNLSVNTTNLVDESVTTAKIAPGAVTTAKIADDNVTTAKLVTNAVTTAKITDANVTNAKLANMSAATIKGSVAGGVPADLSAAQAIANLNAVVGDSGSGGTKGLVPAPTAGDGAAKKALLADGSFGAPFLGSGYIIVRDEKTSGTAGGSSTAGAWTKHALNTEVVDTGGHASLASDVITLQAGTYRVRGFATTTVSGTAARIRLRNTSDGTTPVLGVNHSTNAGAANNGATVSLQGRFTIAAPKNFELQYWVQAAKATDGLGLASSTGEVEVYAELEFVRE